MLPIPKEIKKIVDAMLADGFDSLNKKLEVKAQIETLSNHDFLKKFDSFVNDVCKIQYTPYTETYLVLGEMAIKLFAKGKEQTEVLQFFDELLKFLSFLRKDEQHGIKEKNN